MATWSISIRQPFATAIIHCGKDVENRTWIPKHLKAGDKLAIVASKTWYPTLKNGKQVLWDKIGIYLNSLGATRIPSHDEYLLGGLIGIVSFQGYRKDSQSLWAIDGQCHWLLSNPQPLPFQPIKGRLGIYQIEL